MKTCKTVKFPSNIIYENPYSEKELEKWNGYSVTRDSFGKGERALLEAARIANVIKRGGIVEKSFYGKAADLLKCTIPDGLVEECHDDHFIIAEQLVIMKKYRALSYNIGKGSLKLLPEQKLVLIKMCIEQKGKDPDRTPLEYLDIEVFSLTPQMKLSVLEMLVEEGLWESIFMSNKMLIEEGLVRCPLVRERIIKVLEKAIQLSEAERDITCNLHIYLEGMNEEERKTLLSFFVDNGFAYYIYSHRSECLTAEEREFVRKEGGVPEVLAEVSK